MISTTPAAIKFAIFTVVTLLATALLALTIGNVTFRSTAGYKALFTDAVNLNSGDEVRYAGVQVGSVTGVKLVNGTQALVSFNVDKNVPMTTQTTAAISYRNLIGQRYLALGELTSSTSNQTPAKKGAVASQLTTAAADQPSIGLALRPGSTIPLSKTSPALNLNALFNGFRPLLQALNPDDVNQLSYELVQVLQGEGGTVDTLLSQVGSATTTLASNDQLIGDVINKLNDVLGPIDQRDQQLSKLLGNLQTFISGLSQDRVAIGNSLTSINALAGTTADLLTQARPALKTDVAQLGQLVGKLDTTQARQYLTNFVVNTPAKLRNIAPAAAYASIFNEYLCAVSFVLPDGSTTQKYTNTAPRCS
ncbi:MAG TPA: MCE family protein [Frankiaceae bacterium]|jgi:phospholipid/cholesterol/gamma-HCH transport system substrate-binding protein|nr:MCE family protein [Frankiaceae bacterium]